MYMDQKMDNGDIISSEETIIKDSDNLESLYNRLSLMGRSLLLKTLPSIIDGTNARIKQDISEVTYAYNITRDEEHIDFNKTARDVFNLIRGLSPIPGAYFILDNENIKVYSSYIKNSAHPNHSNGEIVEIYKDGIGISVKDTEIVITELKPFGKKKMSARDYLNGVKKENLIGKICRW